MNADGLVVAIEITAGLVQLCAAAIAFSVMRVGAKHWAWMALTLALVIQVWRRLVSLFDAPTSGDMMDAITALLVSSLVLAAVVGIRYVFLELAETKARLEHLASSDALTELPNRTSFLNALEREIMRVQRGSRGVVLFLDIDGFKVCNDLRGHAFGDRVLKEVARSFKEEVRGNDMVARMGGDEFAVMLDGVGLDEGGRTADRLRSAVRRVGSEAGLELDLSVGSVSIGALTSPQEVLAAADTAMYAAKRMGAGHSRT